MRKSDRNYELLWYNSFLLIGFGIINLLYNKFYYNCTASDFYKISQI